MTDTSDDQQQRSIARALPHARLTIDELWMRYFALGGDAALIEIDAYVHGLTELPSLQRDILAHAVNERLDELTPNRAVYSRSGRGNGSRSRSLSGLVRLLEGAELAPPDRLPVLLDAAADALGVQITMYLADYDERRLHPWPVNGRGVDRSPLSVDSTLAGRAFRETQTLTSTAGSPQLWVPLLDGVERLGVLKVEVQEADELVDPGLRSHCRWLSMLLGHLVTLLTQYGDASDRVRLPTPRTVSGELVWSLLPPLTAGVDSFVVSGAIEPRQGVHGDVFDYALSESSATLIIVDAAGEDLRSGLIAATALAAHRNARRTGGGLPEQARNIDEMICKHVGGGAYISAVLAEVDLATGRLRYVNAGHPAPLVMRAGKIVEPLTGGQAPPLGQGVGELTVAEELLRPDDWLVLYTDGVTEARDINGRRFGESGLAALLRREAAAGHPPPETSRRLIQAVVDHQGGAVQDDAAVVLARWTAPRKVLPSA